MRVEQGKGQGDVAKVERLSQAPHHVVEMHLRHLFVTHMFPANAKEVE